MKLGTDSLVMDEIKDMVIADLALAVAFSFIFTGGIGNFNLLSFIEFFPIAIVAVSLSFILHEYMHKLVAQHFGATAAFRKSDTGLLITLVSGAFGFLIGLPGATMIYTNRFTSKEDGYVSLAGPLTNFVVFLVFFAAFALAYRTSPSGILFSAHPQPYTYIELMMAITLFISAWLAYFNMLPVYPLDGSKVFRWNKGVYAVTMAVIFIFLYSIVGPSLLAETVILFIMALLFSFMFNSIRLF